MSELATTLARAATALGEGRLAEADQLYAAVLQAAPDHPDALFNRGTVLLGLGRWREALEHYDRFVAMVPGVADAFVNRAFALAQLGRLDAALSSHAAAIALAPDHAASLFGRAALLLHGGNPQAAVTCHRRVAALLRHDPAVHEALGYSSRLSGEVARARTSYRRALALEPARVSALGHMTDACLAAGDPGDALRLAHRAFSLHASRDNATLLVRCLEAGPPVTAGLWPAAARILSERWARPSTLVDLGWHILRSSGALASADLATLAGNRLIQALLPLAPVDAGIEELLTRRRARLLDLALEAEGPSCDFLPFFCALARQCFLNEYVFAISDAELAHVERLRAASAGNAEIQPMRLVAVAAYTPLHDLPGCERLLQRSWPDEVERVLTQQVREPLSEHADTPSIPRLTPIAAGISQVVRQQYEENPYPRWVDTVAPGAAARIDAYLLEHLPGSGFRPLGIDRGADILIAGCGTGQQAIETASIFHNRSVLAVDLSLASLAYARRKSRELGAPPIEYAQADLTELGTLDRSFDVIESVGVLHHLADPFAGWRVLLRQLRPGGVMRIGLYSEVARRHIVQARAFIVERGYGASPSDIRLLRQELLARRDQPWAVHVVESGDFATTSTCRDLLLHVQEHRLSLPPIADFLAREQLAFLGFDIAPTVRAAFVARFPGAALHDLHAWHLFENEQPDTFRGMYQFWVQKPA